MNSGKESVVGIESEHSVPVLVLLYAYEPGRLLCFDSLLLRYLCEGVCIGVAANQHQGAYHQYRQHHPHCFATYTQQPTEPLAVLTDPGSEEDALEGPCVFGLCCTCLVGPYVGHSAAALARFILHVSS